MSDALTAKGCENFDVLQLRWIRAREICMADRELFEPGNQVGPVTLMQTGQSQVP